MYFSSNAMRLAAGLLAAGIVTPDADIGTIQKLLEAKGPQETVAELNERHAALLSIGEYIIASDAEGGYWHNTGGWLPEKASANGYPLAATQSEMALLIRNLAPDACFVPYYSAAPYAAAGRPALEAF